MSWDGFSDSLRRLVQAKKRPQTTAGALGSMARLSAIAGVAVAAILIPATTFVVVTGDDVTTDLVNLPLNLEDRPNPQTTRLLASNCANCHGTDGIAQPGMDTLAGQGKDVLLKKMLDFKTGAKPATIMHQLTKGYSDAQLEQLGRLYWFTVEFGMVEHEGHVNAAVRLLTQQPESGRVVVEQREREEQTADDEQVQRQPAAASGSSVHRQQ